MPSPDSSPLQTDVSVYRPLNIYDTDFVQEVRRRVWDAMDAIDEACLADPSAYLNGRPKKATRAITILKRLDRELEQQLQWEQQA